jgi:hypothetical protein
MIEYAARLEDCITMTKDQFAMAQEGFCPHDRLPLIPEPTHIIVTSVGANYHVVACSCPNGHLIATQFTKLQRQSLVHGPDHLGGVVHE